MDKIFVVCLGVGLSKIYRKNNVVDMIDMTHISSEHYWETVGFTLGMHALFCACPSKKSN